MLRGAELDDARAFVAAQKALAELRAVIAADPGCGWTTSACTTRWPSCRFGSGEEPQPDRVQVASPLASARAASRR